MTHREIARLSLKDVENNEGTMYNVDNLYHEEPEDYWDVTNSFSTDKWIHLFHERDKYHVIKLIEDDLVWMKEAQLHTVLTGKFPQQFRDHLTTTCKRHQAIFDGIMEHGSKWFVKTNHYSLKYAEHGTGPYYSLDKVVESLVTQVDGHSAIEQDDSEVMVYFFPWIEMDHRKEFRIFVCDNRVTAISQQHLDKINSWLSTKSDLEIVSIIDRVINHFNEHIQSRLSFLGSYVMDLVLVGESERPYFIEPGPFGAKYSSQSSLYHWIIDKELLGDSNCVSLRYIDRP
jgi:hypothetical protein